MTQSKTTTAKTNRGGDPKSLGDILKNYDLSNQKKYISKEFQEFGYRLSLDLSDVKHVGMYIKFAKTMDRGVLETARNFVKDAHNVKNKAALFMWKLGQLKKGSAARTNPNPA